MINKINNVNSPLIESVAHSKPLVIAKADSGASGHYFREQDKSALEKIQQPSPATIVQLPDNTTMSSSHDAELPIFVLSKHAKKVRIFPNLASSSLLSIGQLCNDNCIAIFHKDILQIIKDNKVIMEGICNRQDGLWDIPITPSPPIESINAIVQKKKTKEELASYYHACLFSPTPRTWAQAIKNGNFATWPGLEELSLHRSLKKRMATSMGHLDQERQGLQSTKTLQQILAEDLSKDVKEDYFLDDTTPEKTNDSIATIIPFTESKKGFMDLTGRFPYKSSQGHEYVLVVYDYDSNAILAEPLVSRKGSEIRRGWQTIHNRLKHRGVAPNFYVLDNECSDDLKQTMTNEHVEWQRATPYMHRTNKAERAIRTFKNHFVAGLSTVHPEFPITEWDRLVPQAEMTLNMLRNSRMNPKLSAYAYLFGQFDFRRKPMAPPGTLVAVHVKPDKRASWAPHSRKGFYIGPALEHYRNFTCFMPDTRKEITSDTCDLFAHIDEIPQIGHEDYVQQALSDILAVLQEKSKLKVPSLLYGSKLHDAIIAVSSLLGKAVPKPTLQPPQTPIQRDPPGQIANVVESVPRVQREKISPPTPPRVKSQLQSGTSFKHLAAQYLVAKQWIQHRVHHIYNEHGKRESIETLMKKNPEKWGKAWSNEWGRLAQGNENNVVFTDTIEFILKSDVLPTNAVTYASFVCDYRPLKSEPYRVRIVVGGDKLSYGEDAASPATDMLETKILLNSTISDSDAGARFLSTDLKDFFLASPMARPEYMKVPLSKFPPDIIRQYKLKEKVAADGYVYIKIKKGMYGLKQAAILAQLQLTKFLTNAGYYPIKECMGLWAHKT